MIKSLQSCTARDMGMALRTPNARAAYEQDATTPRSFGLPPTANGFPRRVGFCVSSTEQKKASRSTCKIVQGMVVIIVLRP